MRCVEKVNEDCSAGAGSRHAGRHRRDRYFKAIDAQFEARRTQDETVRYLRQTYNLAPDRAAAVYEEFVRSKQRRYRLFVGIVLASGLLSLGGLIVIMAQNEGDFFLTSLTSLVFAIVPAIFLSPFTVWASLKHWRSADSGIFDAAQVFALYSLVIVAFTLDVGMAFVLFVIALGLA